MTERKAVLVTGGHGGIGRSLCQAFRAAGYAVVATDRSAEAPDPCDAYLRADLEDVVQSASAQNQFKIRVCEALETLGADFGCLVNNAAVQALGTLETLDLADFERSYRINVATPLILARMFAGLLRKSNGSIVNVGSIHGKLTKPGFCAYSVSKAALAGLTRAMALDFGGEVTVNTISPAAIDTPMLREGFAGAPEKLRSLGDHHPVGRIGRPDEVARVAVFLASEHARFITGADVSADGGIGVLLHDPA